MLLNRQKEGTEQIKFVKNKLDELDGLGSDDLEELWNIILSAWKMKANTKAEIK